MSTTFSLFNVLIILSALAVSPAAADDPLEFLHLLQREGYADVAIDYLDQIKTDPNAPKDVMEIWDLEMSRSKNEAAKDAYSPSQARQLTTDSKALLDRYAKAHPDRPEAIQEMAKWSVEQALEAQYLVLRATYSTDKEEKAKLRADARKIFEQIRPGFVAAYQASVKLQDSLPPKATARQRENAAIIVGENRLTVVMVDFYLAQSQEDGPQRTAALTKLIKDFDAIYQDYREAFLGWKAHFFHGRILQELGQISEAKDIYEEVAACDEHNIEDLGDSKQTTRLKTLKRTGLEDFFADVEQYYLQTLYQVSKKDYLEEIRTWRAAHKALSEKCYGYQALTLEYAKNCLEIGKTKGVNKASFDREALKLLGEVTPVLSPYQQDAIKLRRQLNPNATPEQGFEDAVIDGNAALENKKWAEAIACYEKAISTKTKPNKRRLAEVEDALVGCYHNLAVQLYQKGKVDEAIATAKRALKPEFLQAKTAPGIAVFLLTVQYNQCREAADRSNAEKKAKSELIAKVSNTAKSIIKFWPAKEEGDAARIMLMRLAQAQGNMAEADKILSEINPSSKEYPTALTTMGYSHWTRYKDAKKQAKADAEKKIAIDKDRIAKRDEDRRQAVDYTEKAVKALNASWTPDAAMPLALREAQMLLAGIYIEGEDFKQAGSLYKPLIDDILKDSSQPLDETALLIFEGAGQAFLQLGDVENVATVGTKLTELGSDQAQVNRAIIAFAIALEKVRKKAMTESDSAEPAVLGVGASKLKSLTDLQEKIMINLSKREKLSSNDMVWIVKTSSNLGTDEAKAAAAELIERIIDKANNDQSFEKEIEKAKPALQSLGATIQAERGQYDKAKDLIDQLIQTYPRKLEPRVSQAKILTEWAAKDSSKYGDAIAKWDTLRMKLERVSTGSKIDDSKIDPKYEVILNEADCFYKMSQKTKSKDDAKKGLDLLSPYLNLDPKIRTPNDEYKEISLKYFQLGGKLADFLGVPRPIRPKTRRPPSR
ncbi:MAG: hypothetical protein ACLP9L_30090 [Thermoguttaceae bacterium]